MTVPWAVWPFLTVLYMLAVHRVTRLLVEDELPLIRVPRERLCDWLDPPQATGAPGEAPLGALGRSLAYLFTCPWCMSIWVGVGLVAALDWRLSVPWPPLLVLAASSVTGWASQREAEHERRWKLLGAQQEEAEARTALARAQLADRDWSRVS